MSRDGTFRTRYPGYDVLAKWDTPSWNDVTRQVIAKRLNEVPQRRFFTEQEWRMLEAVCDRLLPQPDRPDDPVPIAPWIDDKVHHHRGDGYRYADMPPMEETWRKALAGIDQDSLRLFGRPFLGLAGEERDGVLEAVQKGDVRGEVWVGMNVKRFFTDTLLKNVVAIYYAHPAAWSEMGFGGPAAPRGYVRLGIDEVDPWEAKENPQAEPRR